MILPFLYLLKTEEEQDLVEKIFEEQFSRMTAIAYKILNNKQDAEDAAMNTMHSICKNIEMFYDYDSPRVVNLISVCTRNSAIDIYRANKRDAENLATMDEGFNTNYESQESMEKYFIDKEQSDNLFAAIESLDDTYKIPILLQYTCDLNQNQIGKILGIEANTVANRNFRARKMLYKKLGTRGDR